VPLEGFGGKRRSREIPWISTEFRVSGMADFPLAGDGAGAESPAVWLATETLSTQRKEIVTENNHEDTKAQRER